jgi:hypothetical protein
MQLMSGLGIGAGKLVVGFALLWFGMPMFERKVLPARLHMCKYISFAIAATIVGLAMIFWIKTSVVETNADVARPKLDLSSPMSNPYLPVQELDPVY